MGLRPGSCYSSTKDRPYTRHAVRVQRRDYIGAVPGLKTRQWNMGNGTKEFDTVLDLCAECGKQGVQIRDNAIESARLIINRKLIKDIGREDFFLKVRVYPHHILRENKQAQGAGADRVSKGMSHSFGKPIGRAARARQGQRMLSVLVMEKDVPKAKAALKMARSRFPCKISIAVHHDVQSIGTKPTKTRDMKVEEAAQAEAKEQEEKEAAGAKKEEAKGKEEPEAGKKEEKKETKKK